MKFEAYFVRLHGRRPSKKPIYELREQVRDLESAMWCARDLRDQCEQWDAQYKSASDAWKIEDKDKE